MSKLCSLGAKMGIAKIWAGNAKEFKTRAATTDPSVELISAWAECGESRCGRKQEIAPSHITSKPRAPKAEGGYKACCRSDTRPFEPAIDVDAVLDSIPAAEHARDAPYSTAN